MTTEPNVDWLHYAILFDILHQGLEHLTGPQSLPLLRH